MLWSPPDSGKFDSWDDVPDEQKETFEKLGIPQAEREYLAGVVGVWDNNSFYEGLKQQYQDLGIIFCSMDTAVEKYPELVEPYFMKKCVPPQDNKFSALHGAVWSGGSFVYVPKGVKVDLPLQAYFRMEGSSEGTFEHTLIVADEGSEMHYIEGCTAQSYSVNSMHSAVVEIFVKEGAKARYTTVQNWSKDVYNLNTKRAIVEAEGTVEWVGGSMGAKIVMLYPGSFLMGEHARADHLNVGVASGERLEGHRRQGRAPRAQHHQQHPRQVDLQGRRRHGLPRPGAHGQELAGQQGPRAVRRPDDGRPLALRHLARHPDPEPVRHGRPRGRRRQDQRRAALLPALARTDRRRGRRR